MVLSPLFRRVDFAKLPGWSADSHAMAFAAFRRSAERIHVKPYRTGSLGVEIEAFRSACTEALSCEDLSDRDAQLFFERHFVPALVLPGQSRGFVTGFYEPIVAASAIQTERFRVPLLSRPPDLIVVDDSNRPDGFDSYLAFGRQTGAGIVEYFDRPAIEAGAVAGRGLEIAWLVDPVDAFFIHVQGAARLDMGNGRMMRVTYAAKSGQRFTGPGGILASLGEIPFAEVTMQSIRAWLRAHPERVNEILWQNRSYIFFTEAPVDDATLGPVAAAKVPLTPGRSVAVDRLLHTFGTPFYIVAPELTAFGGAPFQRLMIAQDTGSAILGAARGDIFAGSGDEAGEIAGVVRAGANLYALLPRPLLERP